MTNCIVGIEPTFQHQHADFKIALDRHFANLKNKNEGVTVFNSHCSCRNRTYTSEPTLQHGLYHDREVVFNEKTNCTTGIEPVLKHQRTSFIYNMKKVVYF